MVNASRLIVASLFVLQAGLAGAATLSCIEQGADTTKAQPIISFIQDSSGNVQKNTLATSGKTEEGLFYFYSGQREVKDKNITMLMYSTRQKGQVDKVAAADTLAIYLPHDEKLGTVAKEFHTDNEGNITDGNSYVCVDLNK
ncbi:TPA: hypothetical protein QHU19_003558 [Klebsiella aerogenes]|jgi:hypothetical protein|uniref:hypothetical protein n=1 Tax=Klebsiella TaxID=570 RepID=UPI0005DD6B49|nr:hypothetical protein [Klebsiella aerogenes]AKK80785.1 hypothetical protein ABY61_05700 [Klebsiella aerogenes]ATM91011.1 hypothetical protein CRN78_11020 [Klebsiella aerogenes]EIV5434892.1 hypothetical protein [Klebsiella aerogenes]EIV6642035.1 hypothetical protein [Klebsiella aerogenes]EIW8577212.1 hypothetical protein [Klebsiella aerogenes]